MLARRLPRTRLGHFPTPLHEMPRLSAALEGPRLYVKRDDLTGLATGGNKTRKLEFIVGKALEDGVDTLVTLGGPQSNHCRQTAAAAARCGLRCILVLKGAPPDRQTGNLLLDRLLGAEVVFSGERTREAVAEQVLREETSAGRRPFFIPLGGSMPTGAAGLVLAMEELQEQLEENKLTVNRVFFASSSFGTQAGLCLGAKALGFRGRLEAIAVDSKRSELQAAVASLANETSRHLDLHATLEKDEILAHDDYLGGGYGVLGAAEREAIVLVARCEGILLDPVYTGRAMAGMLDLIRRGGIGKDETVLFWHTGGNAALDAYSEKLLENESVQIPSSRR